MLFHLVFIGRLPAIPSPTICVWSGDRPDASGFYPPRQALSFASRLATHADRIEFTPVVHRDGLCYGLVVLSPLLSTSHRWDAVTVRYRTILHRTEADFHRSIFLPSQAHWRNAVGVRSQNF